MTALNFVIEPDRIFLAMDTLVVRAEDKRPLGFQRKFICLPEADLVVAGTGDAGFINGWFSYAQVLADLGNIDRLNEIAPDIFKASAAAAGGLESTVTLYHFGYSPTDSQYVGYAYRSEMGFQPHRLASNALGTKPPIEITPIDDIRFPDFLIQIMVKQQARDCQLPVANQVGIGGEIEFVALSERSIRVETVYRFDSYEAELRRIAENA